MRIPDHYQYSSITVVAGHSQVKRPLMNRAGARVNMQLLDQDEAAPRRFRQTDALSKSFNAHSKRDTSDVSVPRNILPGQFSPSHKQKIQKTAAKTTDDLTPTKTHAELNQGLYENTSEAMYSEIFTIKKITDDINNLTDKSLNYTSSGESSPTESILMAPEIHDLMSHTNRSSDNCQNFGGIPTLLETDLEGIGEADSPNFDDGEFQKTLFFPEYGNCCLSQSDMQEFDPLVGVVDEDAILKDSHKNQEILEMTSVMTSAVTLEELNNQAKRNSAVSQSDSGFDGKIY